MSRHSKYKAIRTVVDGIWFHSQKEAGRYSELKLLERAGEIRNLELQPKFEFQVGGKTVFKYFADFAYFDRNRRVIEDVKGYRTKEYQLKKKLIEAQFGVEIHET